MRWIRWFRDLAMEDVALVGGKNASLGEMIRHLEPTGVRIPHGFAVTAEAYRHFIRMAGLEGDVAGLGGGGSGSSVEELVARTHALRERILATPLPDDLAREIVAAYASLSIEYGSEAADVAVRSSATAEDLPTASFAGQQETFLNVVGSTAVLDAVRNDFASLFTPRAIHYQRDMGFDPARVALAVGVQKMVRSDLACSGVIFTLDTESGHRGVVLVTSSFGLGENVVQGRVIPDQFFVHKDTLRHGFRSIVWKKLGTKEMKLVYDADDPSGVRNVRVSDSDRAAWSVSDADVLQLARWALAVEDHYSKRRGAPTPMDLEWARDGRTGDLFVVQARPETVHSQQSPLKFRRYRLTGKSEPVLQGLAIGERIAAGQARVIRDPRGIAEFQAGEILVTEATDPDWEPIMKIAAGIVTAKGGRTSHAAIVARELGIPAIVGAEQAMDVLKAADPMTISCAEGETGFVYRGRVPFEIEEIDATRMPRPRTRMMLNVGNPDQAFQEALLPSDGVGLARMEFVFASWVRIHPLALTRYDSQPPAVQREIDALTPGYPDKTEYFVDRLAQGIGTLAAAFHPRPVILRFSDFKTNEYAKLVGGAPFEPVEENPMLGWRGASRYYHPSYKEGFLLEVAAVRRVREVFGLTNLKVMIPFCRTPKEGRQVLEVMREGGIESGRNGLEVYVMAEIPSNILLAEEFASLFDGFSIGSNDLTQLTLGIDRDSATVAPLFDERNDAVKWSCARLIEVAHSMGCKVGICGQAPSDYPEFAAFLVERGIDSISLSSDALLRTTVRVAEVETQLAARRAEPGHAPIPFGAADIPT
jgi:pyruvate,water dikinase